MQSTSSVWILAVGEPLETDGDDERLLRVGLLAKCLAALGHRVTWWTSAFDHRRKRFRAGPESFAYAGVHYRLLRGCGYTRNVSLRRIRDQRNVAAEFARLALCERELPDVLLAAYPTVELAGAAVDYGNRVGRPVIVDIRDLWPDIFESAVSAPLRPVARLVISYLRRRSAGVLRRATAITGITQSFVDWGVRRAGREPHAADRPFPLAFERVKLTPAELTEATRALSAKGVGTKPDEVRVVFTGSLSRQFDFEPVFCAAEALRDVPIQFVIAGAGEAEREMRARAAGLANLKLVGWLGRVELAALLSSATLALAPYLSTWDFEASIPNKIIEYLAYGLPVLSTLRGEVEALIRHEHVGITTAATNSYALAGELRSLFASPSEIVTMSSRARALFESRFSATMVYPSMAQYLHSLATTLPHLSHQSGNTRR